MHRGPLARELRGQGKKSLLQMLMLMQGCLLAHLHCYYRCYCHCHCPH